jgi:hypothetical protein
MMMDALLDGEPCGRHERMLGKLPDVCMRLRSTVSEVPGATGQLSRDFEFQGAILHK